MGIGGSGLRVAAPAACALAGLLLLAAPALALPPDRSAYVPAGLTQAVVTDHFAVHYDPATPSPEPGISIDAYAQLGAADFEEAYGRDVTGGGLSPNAGLRVPVADDDGKTDVYIARPLDHPQMSGGLVYRDSPPWSSAYVFMTPNLGRRDFRFRAAHEFMHVVQNAYGKGLEDGLVEAFANWAVEWAMPEIDPLDSNFFGDDNALLPHPWTPLDCEDLPLEDPPCGGGYWRWLFVQAQVEDFGPGFVRSYYERYEATPGAGLAALLDQQIRASSGGAEELRRRFSSYAREVWDPTRWTTGSIRRLRVEFNRRPAAHVWTRDAVAMGPSIPLELDHLAARYVLVVNDARARPGDLLVVSWTRPPGMAAPVTPLIRNRGQEAWADGTPELGTAATVSIPLGPDVEEVVLPLVNDSLDQDGAAFSYGLSLVHGPDATAPKTSILRHPPRRTTSRTARFVFGADEPARFQCKRDRRRFRPCPRRFRFGVGEGRHRLAVRAVDRAGNVDATPARFSWRVAR
jgi:hypothetical protein